MRICHAWLSAAHFAKRLAVFAEKLLREELETCFEYLQLLFRQGFTRDGVSYERITRVHELCDGLGNFAHHLCDLPFSSAGELEYPPIP
jgi:hypothetical protein